MKSGLVSLVSIAAFVALVLSNVFLTGKRMGHNFYIVEFFISGVVFFVVMPAAVIVRNEKMTKFVAQKFVFLTKRKNQVCPMLETQA